jgi:hypothetical protein
MYSGLNHLVTIHTEKIPKTKAMTPPMTPPMIAPLLTGVLASGSGVGSGVGSVVGSGVTDVWRVVVVFVLEDVLVEEPETLAIVGVNECEVCPE